MAKTRSILATDSILVKMRPNTYYRDRATGHTYHGQRNQPGSPKFRAGSPPFRISRLRWERDAGLPGGQKIFTRIGEDEPIDA